MFFTYRLSQTQNRTGGKRRLKLLHTLLGLSYKMTNLNELVLFRWIYRRMLNEVCSIGFQGKKIITNYCSMIFKESQADGMFV